MASSEIGERRVRSMFWYLWKIVKPIAIGGMKKSSMPIMKEELDANNDTDDTLVHQTTTTHTKLVHQNHQIPPKNL